jgi:hypothetical protein
VSRAEDDRRYEDLAAWTVEDVVHLFALLWNLRFGRLLAAEDRRFPEHVDLGGEA